MTDSAILASGLRKSYRDKVVLDGIDLDVREGTVFSLLGPNGAGKTTAVNVLTTLSTADAGTVRVAGHDIATETKAVRAAIGVTGQSASVDELLTGRENLRLMADLHHLPLQLPGGALGDQPAPVEHGDPVGELVGLLQV
ncbi:ATP-binding cassette domain-containing protein, partial [Saccharothrix sp. MB29]|nr:ATP-binding cassette domain-containing protein [Saccharothrix sp. MB29]